MMFSLFSLSTTELQEPNRQTEVENSGTAAVVDSIFLHFIFWKREGKEENRTLSAFVGLESSQNCVCKLTIPKCATEMKSEH